MGVVFCNFGEIQADADKTQIFTSSNNNMVKKTKYVTQYRKSEFKIILKTPHPNSGTNNNLIVIEYEVEN